MDLPIYSPPLSHWPHHSDTHPEPLIDDDRYLSCLTRIESTRRRTLRPGISSDWPGRTCPCRKRYSPPRPACPNSTPGASSPPSVQLPLSAGLLRNETLSGFPVVQATEGLNWRFGILHRFILSRETQASPQLRILVIVSTVLSLFGSVS